jgi:hypothetical protein
MAFRLDANGQIDSTDPNNFSDQVLDERETRKRLLTHARIAEVERGVKGLEKEMLMIFAKADRAMKLCSNDEERKDIGKLYAIEIFRVLNGGGTEGQLIVDGQIVYDAGTTKKEIIL